MNMVSYREAKRVHNSIQSILEEASATSQKSSKDSPKINKEITELLSKLKTISEK
jgi:hypothetical protein